MNKRWRHKRKKSHIIGEFKMMRRPLALQRARRRAMIKRMVVIALGGICLFSVTMIGRTAVRSAQTKRLNAALSKQKAELKAELREAAALPDETPQRVENQPVIEELNLLPEPSAAPLNDSVVKSTVFHRVGGTALPYMEELYNLNHDLIGWIDIPNILDLPVMYRDNTYYLTHDFNKQKSVSGAIFLDENHRFGERTQNLLLHGHNMKDGTMFGRLTHYVQDIDYYKQHAFIDFDTLWEEQRYVIFAVLRVSLDVKDESFINFFSHPTFETDEEFDAYVRKLQLRSVYAIPLNVKPSDALLTLSTCLEEERLVLVCRRWREDESRSSLRRFVNMAAWQ